MKKMKKMKIRLVIALALTVCLVTSAIGFSAFAAAPYTEDNPLPGYNKYNTADLDENGNPIEDGNGDIMTHVEEEIWFDYSYYSPYDNELDENCSYPVWESDKGAVPGEYFENGYTVQLSDIFEWPTVGEEEWVPETESWIIFRGWSLSEGGDVITQVTEENFGCTFYPIITAATIEETEEIERRMEEEEAEDKKNREENGVAVISWEAGFDEYGNPLEAGEWYLLLDEIDIVITPLSGDALAAALAKAGVNDPNGVAYDIKIYPKGDDAHETPLRVRAGKTIHVRIRKPNIEGVTSYNVVHIKDDGSTEVLAATVNGDYLEFDAPSFSGFVPSPGSGSSSDDDTPSSDTPSSDTATTAAAATTTTTASSNADKGSSDSPSTGEGSLVPVVVIFVLSVFAAAGAVTFTIFRKKTAVEGTEE